MPTATLKKGIEIFYEEHGEGPLLLLVMGIGAQLVYWPDGFCERLVAEGFRVVRFDNRDVGHSSKLDHLGVPPLGRTLVSALTGLGVSAPYGLEDMADDAAGLLDELGVERAHVVGASMGGMIAQTMAFTHPHRVQSLVSIMSHTGRAGVYVSEPRALRALFQKPPRNRDDAMDRAAEFFAVVGSRQNAESVEVIRERAGRAWDRGSHPRGVLRHLGAIAASGDRTARLRFVRAPTLVIHGSADPLVRPVGGRLTRDAIEGARLEIIEGMGHDLPRGHWPRLTGLISEHALRAQP